ncbi:hypothetical protein [Roseospira navarrensis]|uniref:Uncharacterized protein n=1 Tax=Roseospira navarrensis TaxID=140058 RepID=A0A7X2D623_9PROT|nr:hypothetical protein [Roseospira navarrensis]MQX37870.1 hypothetical protein [Roseospira navarrensis]
MTGIRLQPSPEAPEVVQDLIPRLRGTPTRDLHHHDALRSWSTGRGLGTWRMIDYLAAVAGCRLVLVPDPDAARRAADYQPRGWGANR